ncbi:EAL and HDOD domain-containing protein [Photobacterium lucens]|uniref:EAL and HDOD domain-containing protein n=1 Tax=Photobacterium lucens TaxID=2562949 RepID=UPI0006B69FB4|nr:HDOD domain-containing protein [Photobacterium lucens]KPA53483.1 histidine kinase [Photobacterium leiognathi subsp. mandapamensis]MBP2701680.1 HDOD domain-containing protein [Vibrio parahaemolyticus]MZG57455.1 HDOD domain-containing protein [Photobacterium lucens]MZG79632.1 HDOD domain-containing protein [Photobacterium lucens]
MYSYVARQPIFNRKQQTIGYELLFRDGESNAFPNIDANEATCRLVMENYMAIGDNRSCKGQRNFINFPQHCLIELMPLLLPKDKVVIEILESCSPSDELLSAVKHLHQKGYVFALDDFDCCPEWQRFLPYISVIKLDLLALGVEASCQYVRDNQHLKAKFLAEKVETYDDYAQAQAAGFHLFQGYFFSKPEVLKSRKVAPSELTTVQLLHEIAHDPVDFARIEKIISSDVSLSYLLLRYVNTVTKRLRTPISSFRQALVYLGEDNLRLFIGVVATAHAALDKPKELYSLSLLRAKMCELMVTKGGVGLRSEQAFLAGMFSLLDALLDNSLDSLLDMIQLQPEIKSALLQRNGRLGLLLDVVDAFCTADWTRVSICCQVLGIKEEVVRESYLAAVDWADKCTAVNLKR